MTRRSGTFHQLVFHFVWATKNRLPLITPNVEARLFPYIGAKCKELDYFLHAVNGTEDHIHLLIELTPSILLADVAKNLKGTSSHYINHNTGLSDAFYWQDGYGVVSLRKAETAKVRHYVLSQKAHHQTGKLSELLEQTEP